MIKLNKRRGFTLIELVVVIAILSILAATAAPKFIKLSRDSRIATHTALEGSMRSVSNLVNLKAKIEEKADCSLNPTVSVGGESITLRCGFPCPHNNGIAKAVDVDGLVI